MAAVMEDLWPRCPYHRVDLVWDVRDDVMRCPDPTCDYERMLPSIDDLLE